MSLELFENGLKNKDESYFLQYSEANFENNYRTSVPDFVWEMKHLRILDLTNNKLKNIPFDEIKSMDSLNTIILTGNPLDKNEVEKLRSETALDVKF